MRRPTNLAYIYNTKYNDSYIIMYDGRAHSRFAQFGGRLYCCCNDNTAGEPGVAMVNKVSINQKTL